MKKDDMYYFKMAAKNVKGFLITLSCSFLFLYLLAILTQNIGIAVISTILAIYVALIVCYSLDNNAKKDKEFDKERDRR